MPAVLKRPDPFTDLGELRDRMIEAWLNSSDRTWTPAIDVERDKNHLILRADMPGVEPKDVKITVEDGILQISWEHEDTKDEENKTYLRRERRAGVFYRSMALPPGVDASKIKAKTKNGILEVTIPLPTPPKRETIKITPATG
jgi:HSP20 family protein